MTTGSDDHPGGDGDTTEAVTEESVDGAPSDDGPNETGEHDTGGRTGDSDGGDADEGTPVLDPVREQLQALGGFIRSQRKQAQMSLRDLASATNVSNPYLSQIERGLHEPSVRVLRSIAVALNLSLETLLVRAGVLEPDRDDDGSDVERAILADTRLSDDQRASLLAVYRSYSA